MWSILLPGHHKNHLIWVDSSLMVILELSLVLSAFGYYSRFPASCMTVLRTIWSEWTRSGQFPLAFLQFSSWEPFLGRSMIIVHTLCIHCVLFHSIAIIHSFCSSMIQFFCSTISALDYWSIILFLFIVLILELYSRYSDPVNNNCKANQ